MNGYKYSGDILNHTPGSAVAVNEVVDLGNILGIAVAAIAASVQGALRVAGAISVTKEAGTAWTQGQAIYYDADDEDFTSVAAGNKYAGVAAEAATSGATSGVILLNHPPAGQALNGLNAANVANSQTTPGIPVVFAIPIASGAAASVDVTIDQKVRVIDVWAQHTGGAGETSDTIQLLSTGDAITDAMSWAGGDNDIVRAAEINDANATVAAGGILRATTTDDDAGTDVGAGVLYVLAIPVA